MARTLVQSKLRASASGDIVFDATPTSGNLLVLIVLGWGGTSTDPTMNDSGWTARTTLFGSVDGGNGKLLVKMWYKKNCAASNPGIAITNGDGSQQAVIMLEYSGIAADVGTDPFLADAITDGLLGSATLTPTASSFSMSAAGLILATWHDWQEAITTMVAGSSYTEVAQSNARGMIYEHNLAAAAGSYTPSFTVVPAELKWLIYVASFADGSGAPSGAVLVGSAGLEATGRTNMSGGMRG